MSQVHPVAWTTPLTRAEMRTSEDSSAALAKRYNVSIAMARKWKGRDVSQDRPHRPHTLATTLSAAQELFVVKLRRMLLLPLDDLLAVILEFINPDVSRSGLDRCLRRDKVSNFRSLHFLRRLQRAAPMKIKNVLTDNGSQFTDRFTSKNRTLSGRHVFDVACSSMGIEHRLCPPRHPQTNGMVERFNGRISDLAKQTRFVSAADLDATLNQYMTTYNHHVTQRALNHQSPIQALKRWQINKPELFVKRVYKQAGLDI